MGNKKVMDGTLTRTVGDAKMIIYPNCWVRENDDLPELLGTISRQNRTQKKLCQTDEMMKTHQNVCSTQF